MDKSTRYNLLIKQNARLQKELQEEKEKLRILQFLFEDLGNKPGFIDIVGKDVWREANKVYKEKIGYRLRSEYGKFWMGSFGSW